MRANSLITLAFLTSQRERKGAEWCRKRGVGRMREVASPNVLTIGAPMPSAEHVLAQTEASEILAAHCRSCGGCRLGRA